MAWDLIFSAESICVKKIDFQKSIQKILEIDRQKDFALSAARAATEEADVVRDAFLGASGMAQEGCPVLVPAEGDA